MRLEVSPAGASLGASGTSWIAPWPVALVAAADALDARVTLRPEYPDAIPVILGDLNEAAMLHELRDRRPVEAILRAADATNPAALGGLRDDADDDELPLEADGPLPSPHGGPLVLVDYRTGVLKPQLVIGLIPAAGPRDVAAHLGFGGFGTCPPAEVHVALARHWHTRHGADVVAVTPDVIEFEVSRPVSSREEARALAWSHYRYCPDLVDHLVGSIEGLAATLNHARWWHFWWQR